MNTQPKPGNCRIDWTRAPSGLVMAIVANEFCPVELVSNQRPTQLASSVPITKLAGNGIAIGGSAAWRYETKTGLDNIAGPGTLFCIGRNPTNTTNGWIVQSSENANGFGVGFQFDDAIVETNSFQLWGNNNNLGGSGSDSLGTDAENWFHRITVTWDGTNTKFYVGPYLARTTANAFVPTAHANRRTRLFTTFSEALTSTHDLVTLYAFDRALQAPEIANLAFDPYDFIIQPRRILWSIPAAVGIAFDAASNSGYQAASASYNWSHTCTGTDRYLVVGVGMLSLAQTVSGITYNSVAMTFLGAQSSVSGAARVELWGLIAPATGSNSIAVTLTGAIASAGVAESYTGIHQTVPTEGFNSAQATNVGAADATVAITTVADNDWVVDVVATDDAAITVGAGQTQRNNVTGAGGSAADSDEGPKTPAGAVTMSWANVGALATWSIAGIALRPIAASGAGGGILRQMMNYN